MKLTESALRTIVKEELKKFISLNEAQAQKYTDLQQKSGIPYQNIKSAYSKYVQRYNDDYDAPVSDERFIHYLNSDLPQVDNSNFSVRDRRNFEKLPYEEQLQLASEVTDRPSYNKATSANTVSAKAKRDFRALNKKHQGKYNFPEPKGEYAVTESKKR